MPESDSSGMLASAILALRPGRQCGRSRGRTQSYSRSSSKRGLGPDDHANADSLRSVAEHEPVAAEEGRRGLPIENAARLVPRRARRQRASLTERVELMRRVEAAREPDLYPFPLFDLNRAIPSVVGRHDLRELPVAARHEDFCCSVPPEGGNYRVKG